jgi:hypothetical protein
MRTPLVAPSTLLMVGALGAVEAVGVTELLVVDAVLTPPALDAVTVQV